MPAFETAWIPLLRSKARQWWEGEFVPYENDPNSGLFFVGGWQRRHWSARAAQALWDFLGREWKWATGFALTCIGLLMTYVRFF